MNVFMVYAHQEPTSFNARLRDAAVATLVGRGHTVVVSDLYADDFDPRLTRRDFREVANAGRFDAQAEQAHAHKTATFAPGLAREMARLDACDLMIWQFPIYWFSVPAILTGWIDRVLAYRYAYGGRWFENGAFKGKRAIIAMTTGAPAGGFGPDGRYGHIDALLWPLHWGTLRFCGFDVLRPQLFNGAARPGPEGDAARAAMIAGWTERLASIENETPLDMPNIAEFGPDGVLLPGGVYRHPLPPRIS